MKRFDDFATSNSTGGAPFKNEDFYDTFQEVYDAINPTIQGLGKQITTDGNFVVSGCVVSANGGDWDISAGVVSLGGELYRFEGATAVTTGTKYMAIATELVENRNYKNGGSKPMFRTKLAEVVSSTSGGEEIVFDPSDTVPFVLLEDFRATQAEVDAGTLTNKYVSPETLYREGWSNQITPVTNVDTSNVFFRKDSAGFVHVEGYINSTLTIGPSSTIVGTVSVGYRPLNVVILPIALNFTLPFARVNITTSGQVSIYPTDSSSGTLATTQSFSFKYRAA